MLNKGFKPNTVHIQALIALSTLKERQSISETAKMLMMNQSLVSKILADLKLEFNDPLYKKENNEFIFTNIGESLCIIARDFIQPGINLIDRIKQQKDKSFAIMVPKWIEISKIRSGLLEKLPDVNCNFSFKLVRNYNLDFICKAMENGEVDMCLCHFPIDKPGIWKKEVCFTNVIFLSKSIFNLDLNNLNMHEFVKYGISDSLFNSFLLENNIRNLTLKEEIDDVEQWLDNIDNNKIIITTDYNYSTLLNIGFSKIVLPHNMTIRYPVHLVYHDKYKYNAAHTELCKIIINIISNSQKKPHE